MEMMKHFFKQFNSKTSNCRFNNDFVARKLGKSKPRKKTITFFFQKKLEIQRASSTDNLFFKDCRIVAFFICF